MTHYALSRLLEWLDDGVDSEGQRYVEMRRRLVAYFVRRNRWTAEELADETLNRVARTLEQDGVIATRPPARYCHVVARYVFLEDCRRERRHVPVHELHHGGGAAWPGPDDGWSAGQERLDWLDHCLQRLTPAQRDLIVEYYADGGRRKIERRRALARRLGISMNALAIRAWRIRAALDAQRSEIPRRPGVSAERSLTATS